MAVDALARPAHVLLSVNSHLGKSVVLFKLLVTGLAGTAAMGSLQAVARVRFLGARAAGSLGLARIAKLVASSITLDPLHSHDLHLIVGAGGKSARLGVGEIGVAALRACRRGLVGRDSVGRVRHEELVSGGALALAVHDVTLLDVSENTKTSLRRDQTAYNFLRHILG